MAYHLARSSAVKSIDVIVETGHTVIVGRGEDIYKSLSWTSDSFPRGLNALFISGMLGLQDVLTESHFLLPSAKGDESRISWLILSSWIVLYVTKYMVSVVRKIPAFYVCWFLTREQITLFLSLFFMSCLSYIPTPDPGPV